MPAARLRTEVALSVAAVAAAAALSLVHVGSAAPGDPELVSVGTFSAPIYVAAPPGDGERVFVVEQGGAIKVVRSGGAPTEFLNIDHLVLSGGERGLFSMAFAPDYAASGRFYVFYTAEPDGALTIAEYNRSFNPDVADEFGRIVLSIPHADAGNHNGGQLQFGPDGYLYIATGDGGGGNDQFMHAQNLDSLLGKLLRIDPSGAPYAIPPDNPFVGQPGVRQEIWSYGLRNPWRVSFDRQTGDLTIGDVGQGAWEEIDLAPAGSGGGRGANFGWACWEGRDPGPASSRSDCTPMTGTHTPPVWQYANDSSTCAITGGYVVRDPALPSLAGRYVYGDLCAGALRSVILQVPTAQDDRPTGLSVANLYSFGEDACGRIYVVSGSGPVYRLRTEGAADPPCVPPAPPSPPPAPQPAPPPPPPADQPTTLRPTPCRVPRVIGRRLTAARARIRRANCRAGRVYYRRSGRARGVVITQAPRPGARRPNRTRVHVTLSAGRRRR
jgi:glucose/arabinose dehydrogenase